MRYGFIGLGSLGRHLAANLAHAGFDLAVHDLNRQAAAPVLERGARWADSIPTLAGACDCLITCLPSPAATSAVLGEALPHLVFIEGRARYGGGAFSSMIVKLLEDAVGTPLRAGGFPARLGEDDRGANRAGGAPDLSAASGTSMP